MTGLTKTELDAIDRRLREGCPTKGVSLSPWAVQLQHDARQLYDEVQRLRSIQARAA